MDQETSDNGGICKNLSQANLGNNERSSNSANGVVVHPVIVTNSTEAAAVSAENGNSVSKRDSLKSEKVFRDLLEREISQESHDGQRFCETLNRVDQRSRENSNCSVDGVRQETVIVINSDETTSVSHETVIVICSDETTSVSHENRESVAKVNNELELSKAKVEKPKTKLAELGKQSCAVDVKRGGSVGGGFKETWDRERVCRICHLSSEGSLDATATTAAGTSTVTMDLIQLGCGCKDELGIAHSHCAEAWFKLKGNRMCEICGESAKNVTGVGDNRFMEEWNEHRFSGSSINLPERGRSCWRGQPFCNFLMACLVIAFVLPWFFRVNMF